MKKELNKVNINKYSPFKNELEKINFLWSWHIKPKRKLELTQQQLDFLKSKYPDFTMVYPQIIPRILENFGKGVWKNVL